MLQNAATRPELCLLFPKDEEFGNQIIADQNGNRLAKRNGSTTVTAMLDSGISPQKIIGDLAAYAPWVPQGSELTPSELLQYYRPGQVAAKC